MPVDVIADPPRELAITPEPSPSRSWRYGLLSVGQLRCRARRRPSEIGSEAFGAGFQRRRPPYFAVSGAVQGVITGKKCVSAAASRGMIREPIPVRGSGVDRPVGRTRSAVGEEPPAQRR
ncbi:hypothetical protein ACFP3U_27880 [Kitasatospora misakiensis]|uniref:Uncharacterized protein n=1 Tax=Kitasatospora misakiensis TaxID=67330 RepID=A0ABW0XAP4_9ACTN